MLAGRRAFHLVRNVLCLNMTSDGGLSQKSCADGEIRLCTRLGRGGSWLCKCVFVTSFRILYLSRLISLV